MARRSSVRRWLFLSVASVAVIACGLEVVGVTTNPAPDEDAATPPLGDGTVTPSSDVVTVDVALDVAVAGDAAIDAACVGDGGFCNYCDPDLVLCIRFDGGARDESRYAHALSFDGSASYISANGLGALSMDGSFALAAATGDALSGSAGITLEVLARIRKLPPDGGRYGFLDRGPLGPSMFVYAGAGGPNLRCQNVDVDSGPNPPGFVHYACTIVDELRSMRLYVNGREVGESDAAGLLDPIPDGSTYTPFSIGKNDPSGDDFMGDIATVRIYARARTPRGIAIAAGLDAGGD